jgi:hypothetical protein
LTIGSYYGIISTTTREENNTMWYIMSRSGLRGIETYTSEVQAWQAADLRNALVNQGWHPIKVEVA